MSIAVYLSVSVHALWAAPARTRFSGGGGGGALRSQSPRPEQYRRPGPAPGITLGGGINGWRSACAPAAGEEVEDPTEDHARA